MYPQNKSCKKILKSSHSKTLIKGSIRERVLQAQVLVQGPGPRVVCVLQLCLGVGQEHSAPDVLKSHRIIDRPCEEAPGRAGTTSPSTATPLTPSSPSSSRAG